MVHILHDLHPQAGDDEEESGPNVSQVTGPEEECRPHPRVPNSTHDQIRGNCHRVSQKLSRRSFGNKLRRASFEGIGMRFYDQSKPTQAKID